MPRSETFMENIGRLTSRISVFNKHAAEARNENQQQLRARVAKLEEAWDAQMARIGEDVEESLQRAITEDIKSRKLTRRHAGSAYTAESEAEVVEAYAIAAGVAAIAAVAEAEKATIEAISAFVAADKF